MTLRRVATTAIITGLVTIGAVAPAHALKDSGIQNYGCAGGKFGRLLFQLQGTGNSWAPGDWSGSPQWNAKPTGYWSWASDVASNTGGGPWRIYANSSYGSVNRSYVNFG